MKKYIIPLIISFPLYGEIHYINYEEGDSWTEVQKKMEDAFCAGHYDIVLKSDKKELNVSPNGYDWKIFRIVNTIKTKSDHLNVIQFRNEHERYILFCVDLSFLSKEKKREIKSVILNSKIENCVGVVLIAMASCEMKMIDFYNSVKQCEEIIKPYPLLGTIFMKS